MLANIYLLYQMFSNIQNDDDYNISRQLVPLSFPGGRQRTQKEFGHDLFYQFNLTLSLAIIFPVSSCAQCGEILHEGIVHDDESK